MVTTRTLSNYLASLPPTPGEDATLVTQDLQAYSTANILTASDVSAVAISGAYTDLSGLPTLGTAAAQNVEAFATAAQGNLADSAAQPSELAQVAFSGSYADLTGEPAFGGLAFKDEIAVPGDITATGTPSIGTFLRGDGAWAVPSGGGGGGGIESVVGGTGIDVDDTDPVNPVVSIDSGYLATVATTGAYSDLSGKPTLGTLAAKNAITVPTDITATGTPSSTTFLRGDGSWQAISGSGTVTSVGVSVPTGFSASGSPVTSSGTIAITYAAGYQGYTSAEAALVASAVQPGDLGDLALLDTINNAQWSGTDLAVANGGTGASDASGARTNLGLVIGTNVQAFSAGLTSWAGVTRATGFDTFAATPSSANLRALLADEVGAGSAYFVGGALGTPASATLTNGTGLPISTGVSGLGTGVATFLGTPTSANLAAAITNETGTGALVFATSPTLVTPALGTPSSGTLTNATGLPIIAGTTGTLTVDRGGTGLATLTANNLLVGAGTGNVSFIAPGTSGNVLTSNGTTWTSTAPSGGATGLVPLGSLVIASSSAALDFVFSGSYREYVIKFWQILPATNSVTLYLRTSTNGGSTYDAGVSDYKQVLMYANESGGSPAAQANSAQSFIPLTIPGGAVGNGANQTGVSGEVRLYNPTASAYCTVSVETGYLSTADSLHTVRGNGMRLAAADVNAARLLFSSGNITSGFAQLYGVVTA